jgi:hypothetical protein
MTTQTAPQVKNEAALDVAPVSGSGTYTWTINLYEYQGKCYIAWKTTAPFRAQQGKVALYSGPPPSDPTRYVTFQWDDQPSPYNTGQPWGAGWSAAWIGQQGTSAGYAYTYVCTTPVTTGN